MDDFTSDDAALAVVLEDYQDKLLLVAQERARRTNTAEFDRDLVASLAFHVDRDTLAAALAEVVTTFEVRPVLHDEMQRQVSAMDLLTVFGPLLRDRLNEGGQS